MSWFSHAVLVVAGVIAGALNAVAGGGSFLTFPALVFVGVAPVTANATSAVALWPGQVASAIAYRAGSSPRRERKGSGACASRVRSEGSSGLCCSFARRTRRSRA